MLSDLFTRFDEYEYACHLSISIGGCGIGACLVPLYVGGLGCGGAPGVECHAGDINDYSMLCVWSGILWW